MSTGVETAQVVEPWLYERLSTDPTLAGLTNSGPIVNASSDETTNATRYVEYTLVSGRDVLGTGGTRVQVDAIYQVKAVVQGTNFDPASSIFARVCDLLITPETVTTANGSLTCHRESIFQYPERQDGSNFRHLGGTFRVRVNS